VRLMRALAAQVSRESFGGYSDIRCVAMLDAAREPASDVRQRRHYRAWIVDLGP